MAKGNAKKVLDVLSTAPTTFETRDAIRKIAAGVSSEAYISMDQIDLVTELLDDLDYRVKNDMQIGLLITKIIQTINGFDRPS